jgi:serine/threonine protein kinase
VVDELTAGMSVSDQDAIRKAIEERPPGLSAATLRRWFAIHDEDVDALTDLITLIPPPDIDLVRRMSQVGSQKVVFEGLWRGLRPIVLKRFIGEGAEEQRKLMERELLPHPLTMTHPNIIETHVFKNSREESFLVEKKLAVVLNDDWRAGGIAEASNLLYDISVALLHLQSRDLVHGDIKPDNLGFEDGRFVLLDFGVSRTSDAFTFPDSATGSIRTRAPELLMGSAPASFASDVFALGAVVFNSLVGAFPFFQPGEDIPRKSLAEERMRKEKEIGTRCAAEYDSLVTERLEQTVRHDGLRELLAAALAEDRGDRPSAGELAASARTKLASFVLNGADQTALAPDEQLDQLDLYLDGKRLEEHTPKRRMMDLRATLEDLKYLDLPEDQTDQLVELQRRFGLL